MSTTEKILTRMMSEPAFADAVFANAEKALAEYNLSSEEAAKFEDLTQSHFESMTAEERKSMMGLSMGKPVNDWIESSL